MDETQLASHHQVRSDLSGIQGALRLSIPVLMQYPHQIASQLTGRLLTEDGDGIKSVLSQIRQRKRPWLRPLTPAFAQSGAALVQTLVGHTESIEKIALTPDGQFAVSASQDKTLKLWDLVTGREIHTYRGHQYPVDDVAVGCRGQRLISCARLHEVKIWDMASVTELWSLACDASRVATIPWSPVAIASTGVDLQGIDLQTFDTVFTLSGHEQSIEAVTVSRDGSLAASGTDEGNIRIWDLKRRVQLGSLDTGFYIFDLAFTPDNRFLVSVDENCAQLWDLKTFQKVLIFHNLERPDGVLLTGNGKVVIFTSESGMTESGSKVKAAVGRWDLPSGERGAILLSDADEFKDVEITPDDRYLLTASSDHSLRIWQFDQLEKRDLFSSHEGWFTNVMFSANGKYAISQGGEYIRVWDAHDFSLVFNITNEDVHVVNTIVINDGMYGFLFYKRGYMDLFDLETGRMLASFSCPLESIGQVEISSDRSRLLAIANKGDEHLLGKYAGPNNWLFFWDIDLETIPKDADDISTLYPVAECKVPRPVTTDVFQGIEVTIGDDPDWQVFDLRSGEPLGELGSYLHWVPTIVEVPGLTKENRQDRIERPFILGENQTGQLVVTSRYTDQPGAVLQCEAAIRSYDLHPDNQTIIAADSKGQVYFLRMEGFSPIPAACKAEA